MKRRTAGMIGMVLVVLLAAPVVAQQYDPKTVETIGGEVVSARSAEQESAAGQESDAGATEHGTQVSAD